MLPAVAGELCAMAGILQENRDGQHLPKERLLSRAVRRAPYNQAVAAPTTSTGMICAISCERRRRRPWRAPPGRWVSSTLPSAVA